MQGECRDYYTFAVEEANGYDAETSHHQDEDQQDQDEEERVDSTQAHYSDTKSTKSSEKSEEKYGVDSSPKTIGSKNFSKF